MRTSFRTYLNIYLFTAWKINVFLSFSFMSILLHEVKIDLMNAAIFCIVYLTQNAYAVMLVFCGCVKATNKLRNVQYRITPTSITCTCTYPNYSTCGMYYITYMHEFIVPGEFHACTCMYRYMYCRPELPNIVHNTSIIP